MPKTMLLYPLLGLNFCFRLYFTQPDIHKCNFRNYQCDVHYPQNQYEKGDPPYNYMLMNHICKTSFTAGNTKNFKFFMIDLICILQLIYFHTSKLFCQIICNECCTLLVVSLGRGLRDLREKYGVIQRRT